MKIQPMIVSTLKKMAMYTKHFGITRLQRLQQPLKSFATEIFLNTKYFIEEFFFVLSSTWDAIQVLDCKSDFVCFSYTL